MIKSVRHFRLNSEGLLIWATYFLFSFPILPYFFQSISIGFFAISYLFYYAQNNDLRYTISTNNKRNALLLFSGYYIFLFGSILYSRNLDQSYLQITKQLPIFFLPFLFFLFPIRLNSKVFFERAQKYFLIVTTILCVYILVEFILNLPIDEVFSPQYVRKVLREKIVWLDLHPTYVSSYIVISLLYKFSSASKISKTSLIVILIHLLTLFLLTSRICISAFMISMIVLIWYRIKITRVRIYFFLGLALLAVSILQIDFVQDRFSRILDSFGQLPDKNNISSTNLRLGVFSCAVDIISENPFLGIGIGDLQDSLNDCYLENYSTTLYQRRIFNIHSHYLFLFASCGLFGLLYFVLAQIRIMKFLFQEKRFFLFTCLLYLYQLFFVESMLQRAYGIGIFLMVLMQVIYYYSERLKMGSTNH